MTRSRHSLPVATGHKASALPFGKAWFGAGLALMLLISQGPAAQARQSRTTAVSGEAWRETYQSSPAATNLTTDAEFDAFAKRLNMPPQIAARVRPKHVTGTIRYRLAISIGGRQVRLRLSNEAGVKPLLLSSVSLGLASASFDVLPGSLKRVTFGGRPGIVIPAGAPAVSDPVDLTVPAAAHLLVSLTGPENFVLTGNGGTALAVAAGDQTMSQNFGSATRMAGRPIVSGIAVLAPVRTKVIAALGDSITDGNRPDPAMLHAWPEQLARRLAARRGTAHHAVVNAGISGNRLLASALIAEMGISGVARLDRDALRIDGLSHIVVLEGINDIGASGRSLFGDNPAVTADELIAGYRQVIARAHLRGAKAVIGTITPFGGSMSHGSPDKEQTRQAVNAWIRTSGEPDGVIDFDLAIRDPAQPTRMQAAYDSGDHLHPNEAGQKAMGDAANLALFD